MSWWYSRYPKRKPKKVKGGIKAQSKRGAFGESWWAKRWNQTLDDYDIGARLSRGRSYARGGQVASITIKKGTVSAVVQGSSRYAVSIKIKTFDAKKWKQVAEAVFANPGVSAQLLAGSMPSEVEDIFAKCNLNMFPKHKEIHTDCTCPDWANPCKHIAAVYLLLAEEFDRDPFLLFRLRGIERKELLKLAGIGTRKKKTDIAQVSDSATASEGSGKKSMMQAMATAKAEVPKIKKTQRTKRLPADPLKFWGVLGDLFAASSADDTVKAEAADADAQKENGQSENAADVQTSTDRVSGAFIPAVPAALVKQLGPFPFWRGSEMFMPSMEEIYSSASVRGAQVFVGDAAYGKDEDGNGKGRNLKESHEDDDDEYDHY